MKPETASENTVNQPEELTSESLEPPLVISEKTKLFRSKYYPFVSDAEWNDWHWQIRNSIVSFSQFKSVFNIDLSFERNSFNLPMRITPYYASLIDLSNVDKHIGKCVIPSKQESITQSCEEMDSLHEKEYSPVENIVHRYPDRVLFLTTDFCSSNCIYCTRTHMVSKTKINKAIWNKGLEYIAKHTEIRDVLLSGGDIFTLDDDSIEYLLIELKKIPHIEIVRIGSKVPIVLPQRITPKLVNMLKKYHPLFINLHFSHPDEITPETSHACQLLADVGIPLGSQTVLLKDVNDTPSVMKKLMQQLLMIRVKPYYIYQMDLVPGTSHFKTKVSVGLDILKELIGNTSGLCNPHYIIDLPGGGGKIPILPNYILNEKDNVITLMNFEGKTFEYYE